MKLAWRFCFGHSIAFRRCDCLHETLYNQPHWTYCTLSKSGRIRLFEAWWMEPQNIFCAGLSLGSRERTLMQLIHKWYEKCIWKREWNRPRIISGYIPAGYITAGLMWCRRFHLIFTVHGIKYFDWFSLYYKNTQHQTCEFTILWDLW